MTVQQIWEFANELKANLDHSTVATIKGDLANRLATVEGEQPFARELFDALQIERLGHES